MGAFCITSIVHLGKVLTPENRDEMLPRFFHRSRREAMAVAAEVKPAEAAPRREVVTAVRAAPTAALCGHERQPPSSAATNVSVHPAELPLSVSPAVTEPAPPVLPRPAQRDSAEPLTGELSRLHVTVSRRFLEKLDVRGIDWVIVGGESGGKCRPMNAAWVREIRDRCRSRRVPFFFKQWGGFQKKKNGRELDGRTWDAMPPRRRWVGSGRSALTPRSELFSGEDKPEPPCKPGLTFGDLAVSAARAQVGSGLEVSGETTRSPDHAKSARSSATREQNGIQPANAPPLPPVQGELFLRAGIAVAERCATAKLREAVLRRASRQAAQLVDAARDRAATEPRHS